MIDQTASYRSTNASDSIPISFEFPDMPERSPPLITPAIAANVIAAMLASVSLAAVAVLADILGYVTYCLAKKSSVSGQEIGYFALVPAVGSLIFGALLLLILSSSKLVSKAIFQNDYCAQVSIRMLVLLNFVVNMILGFLEDHLFGHDKMMVLMWPCLWSKIIALSIVAFTGAVLWASGADNYIGRKLAEGYEALYQRLEVSIGQTSSFYQEGGYKGRLMHCFTYFCRRTSANEQHRAAVQGDVESSTAMVTEALLPSEASSAGSSATIWQ